VGARKVTRKPEEVRRASGLDEELIEKLHAKLKGIRVDLDPEPSAGSLRERFAKIRQHRNTVVRIAGSILPRVAMLRADLVRVERVIEAETAMLTETGHAVGNNAQERQASLKQKLREWHDARAEVRADLHMAEEVISHAKWVRDELRFAFEETSRSLASIELEWKIERDAP